MRSAYLFFMVLCVSVASLAQSNPVPFVSQPLDPASVSPGAHEFTLTVNGTGFVSGSVVQWNRTRLATTFINGKELTAAVPAAEVAVAGAAEITVVSPSPGGGTSNTEWFEIATPIRTPGLFTRTDYSPGALVQAVFSGDFNGDGIPDLAEVYDDNGNTLAILLGQGDGTFVSGAKYPITADFLISLTGGDFNGDGKLDLALVDQDCPTVPCASGEVTILLGKGDGTFEKGAATYATGQSPWFIAAADFNGDGKLDLATANLCTNCGDEPLNAISVLLGNGDGTFQPPIETVLQNASAAYQFAVGDLNGDGKLDVVAADYYCGQPICTGEISVLLGKGDGTFQPSTEYITDGGVTSVVIADLNGDGHLDVAAAESGMFFGQSGAGVFLGNGDGTLQKRADYGGAETTPWSIAAGDFNDDGRIDLAITNWGELTTITSSVSLLLGNGDGSFQPQLSYPIGVVPQSLVTGDFNRDGRLDMASADYNGSAVSVLVGSVLAASNSSVNFPVTILIGASSQPEPVILTNVGPQTVHLGSITITGADQAYFTQNNNCGTSLTPGKSCTANLTFSPQSIGVLTANLTIADNTGQGQQTIPLGGVATQVRLSPASLSFGSQAVGTTSNAQVVTLTNLGAQFSFYEFSVGGVDPHDFSETHTCTRLLAARGTCTITVTFTPRAMGSRSATVYIHDGGGGSPQQIALSGTGT